MLYHAYQHRLVDLWNHADQGSKDLKIFRRVISYEEEFQNYVDSGEDFYSYYRELENGAGFEEKID